MYSCECYRIDGKFIAEDPDCPAHGTDAQRRQSEKESAVDAAIHVLHKALYVVDVRLSDEHASWAKELRDAINGLERI
jgi:hypothetical protein